MAGLLVPGHLRQDYCNLYAYCRWADDLGDESGDPAKNLELLAWWRGELAAMDSGAACHPVFVALRETAARHSLPRADFEDLLTAFERDQTVTRYRTYADLLDYCRYSANPVGRLVLRLNGHSDPALFRLSDATCTALQLANHWQDVRRDWRIDRVYLPADVMRSHAYSIERLERDIARGSASEGFRNTVRDLCSRARELFDEGFPLADHLGRRLAIKVELFSRAGTAVLDRIEGLRWDTIALRPTVGKRVHLSLLARVMARRLFCASTALREARNAHG